MKIVFILAFVSLGLSAAAQNKILFSSQNYAGLAVGEHGSKFQLQTINGVKYKTWFAGMGTGLDWYYQRSIPAFISLSKEFYKKENRNFFASADAGVNFPWKDNSTAVPGYEVEKLLLGLYWGMGLGYKIGIGKKNDALLLKLGYSYKYSGEKVKPLYFYIDSSDPYSYERFDYRLRRLSLEVGWNF